VSATFFAARRVKENEMKKVTSLSVRLLSWVLVFSTSVMLTACYVVPINPQTGQAYPPSAQPAGAPAGYAAIPINTNATFQAKLYPINDVAGKAGVIIATATDTNNGRGVFSMVYMGETLNGDASRVDASSPGFGRIYKEVLGTGYEKSPTGRRGIANAFGTKGTSVQCEYQMTAKDIGTGACLFSNGAKYQMHFGG